MPQPRRYETRAQQQAAYRQRCKRVQTEMLSQKGLPPMPAISAMPGKARWRAALEQARCLTAQTASEMQNYYYDRSEQWKESPRGEELEEKIAALEEIADQLQDAANNS